MTSNNYMHHLASYKLYLHEEERSHHTIQKYVRDIKKLFVFLQERALSKAEMIQFKQHLTQNYPPTSVNSILASINGFLQWLGFATFKVKPLKIQKEIFSTPEKELTQREYERLIMVAEKKQNKKLSLLLQTICSTGIRVSELKHITILALHTGRTVVTCKGKNRTVFLPKELCKALKLYCSENQIIKGSIFITKSGTPLDRSNIWKMMKKLCSEANVSTSKVFPHNLRHLFARTYYKIEKDISRLADILGHSSITTTRIYTMETGIKHAKQIDKMNLTYPRQ